jgi:two-component system probable response regulator PhcQ
MESTVLLVDDDENVLHGLARVLRKQPYQLFTAASAEEAVWILKTHNVDVIVADEKMPGMAGGDLLAWTAEHFPQVMRIVLTGHATVDSAIRAINQGSVCHYFTKPCKDVDLAIAIRKALEHRELAREHHSLLKSGKRQLEEMRLFTRDLETIERIVSDDLHGHLKRLVQACQPTDEQSGTMLDRDAKLLVDNVLDAAADVRRLVSGLLARCRAGQATSTAAAACSDEQQQAPEVSEPRGDTKPAEETAELTLPD